MSNAVLWCFYCHVQICKCHSAATLYSQSWCWLAGNIKLPYLCDTEYSTRSCLAVQELIRFQFFSCVLIVPKDHQEDIGWWCNKDFFSLEDSNHRPLGHWYNFVRVELFSCWHVTRMLWAQCLSSLIIYMIRRQTLYHCHQAHTWHIL